MISQEQRILTHLASFGSITPKEAMDEYGIMRLGARIYDLRQDGYDIRKTTEVSRNRYGQETRYARYFMEAVNG